MAPERTIRVYDGCDRCGRSNSHLPLTTRTGFYVSDPHVFWKVTARRCPGEPGARTCELLSLEALLVQAKKKPAVLDPYHLDLGVLDELRDSFARGWWSVDACDGHDVMPAHITFLYEDHARAAVTQYSKRFPFGYVTSVEWLDRPPLHRAVFPFKLVEK